MIKGIIKFFQRKIRNVRVGLEGGSQESLYLRRFTEKRYHVNVGLYSYGSCFDENFNNGGKSVRIGRYSSFGPNVKYFGANHPYWECVMSPYFYEKKFGFDVDDIPRFSLYIGNDVWIGADVIITAGCRYIADGAVVAAGTVLTRDVEKYNVVAGNPGKVIKKRFTDDQIDKLVETQWWELTPTELLQFYEFRDSPERFAEEILKYRGLNKHE